MERFVSFLPDGGGGAGGGAGGSLAPTAPDSHNPPVASDQSLCPSAVTFTLLCNVFLLHPAPPPAGSALPVCVWGGVSCVSVLLNLNMLRFFLFCVPASTPFQIPWSELCNQIQAGRLPPSSCCCSSSISSSSFLLSTTSGSVLSPPPFSSPGNIWQLVDWGGFKMSHQGVELFLGAVTLQTNTKAS